MKRPVAGALAFYLIGLLFFDYIIITSIVISIWMLLLYKKTNKSRIFILIIFYAMGVMLRYQAENYSIPIIEDAINSDKKLYITGNIKEMGKESEKSSSFVVSTDLIFNNDENVKIKTDIQASVKASKNIEVGDTITLIGKPYKPKEPKNEGQFDEKKYMLTKKRYYKFFGEIDNVQTNTTSSVKIKDIREKIIDITNQTLPQKESGLMNGMLIGENSGMDKDLRELYSSAGISHIIAISGAHILVLCAIIYKLLGTFIIERKPKAIVTIIFLIFYGVLTGGSASAVRAVIMGCIMLLADVLDRERDMLSSIAVSALVLLIYNPMYIYDVGFLLSYAAVIGIITTVPIINKGYNAPKVIKEMLSSTIAALLWTTPIIAYFFYEVPMYALFVNLLVIPLSSLLLIVGILGVFIGVLSIEIAKSIMIVVKYILVYYESIAKSFVNLPFSKLVTGQPNLLIIIVYYAILIATLWYASKPYEIRKIYKKYRRDIVYSILIIIILVIVMPKPLRIKVLDVGQGDSIVVHTEQGKTILFDGGGEKKNNEDIANTGKNVISKYLKYSGINKIDVMISTHPDYDHIKGLIELIELTQIGKLILPIGNCNETELAKTLIEKARKKNIPIYYFKEDDKFILDGITFTCLYPQVGVDSIASNNNDYSLVFKMDYKDKSTIFTGDIEEKGEKYIVNKYKNLKTDILKVAHHGSATSSTKEFINALKPEYAIICVGNNNYGHPKEEILNRLQSMGTHIYTTKEKGSIEAKLSLGRWNIR